MEFNNFYSAMGIMSALVSSSVHRLASTWENITEFEMSEFRKFQALTSSANNFKAMREAIPLRSPPVIPYLGMYLTDLIFIEEGIPDSLPGGLINFSKRRQVATLISSIQQVQLHRYHFSPVEELKVCHLFINCTLTKLAILEIPFT